MWGWPTLACELMGDSIACCAPSASARASHTGRIETAERDIACIVRLNRANAAPSTPAPRTKRPYSALQPTQRWKRRCKARFAVAEVLDVIGCPLEAITPRAPITPTKVLHLTPAERHRTRTVRCLHFPCETIHEEEA